MFGLTVISAAMNLLVLRFLTMNTADEKRDKQEAQLAARGFFLIFLKRKNNLQNTAFFLQITFKN